MAVTCTLKLLQPGEHMATFTTPPHRRRVKFQLGYGEHRQVALRTPLNPRAMRTLRLAYGHAVRAIGSPVRDA